MSSSSRVTTAACLLGAGLFLSLPNVPEQPADPIQVTVSVATQGVSVTPDAATAKERTANTRGHVLTFTVTNTGSEADTYEVTCVGVARATCGRWSPTRVALRVGESATVDASFEVHDAGTGLVSVIVFSPVTKALDRGSYRVPVTQ